jgi:hypothetical protein
MLKTLRARLSAGQTSPPKSYDPARPLCFMHIPKASGTSFTACLCAAIAPGRTVSGFDPVLFGDFSDFDAFSAEERQRIFLTPADVPAAADFVAGHFAYATLRAAYPGAQLVTVLREPFARVLSLWMFWRRTPDSALAGVAGWGDYVRQARRPLKAFLGERRVAAQTDNMTLRMLLWPHPHIPQADFIDPAHDARLLRAARQRLENFDFAAIMEAPDFLAELQAYLGRKVCYGRLNETGAMPAALQTPFAAELDAETVHLLDARSRLDLALWEEVAGPRASIRQQTILQHVARIGATMAR